MIDLQPLRVASGWTIKWNTFMNTDPLPEDMTAFSGSSLLHAYNRNSLRAIDLEWTPEEDFDGEFYLRVINLLEHYNPKTEAFDLVGDWENLHLEFRSKERMEIVLKIELLMLQLPAYQDPRILKSRGVVFEEAENLRFQLKNSSLDNELAEKIIKCESKQLHLLLIDHPEVQKKHLEELINSGPFRKIANRASQKLNSKAFKNR